MKVQDFIHVTSSEIVTILDGAESKEYVLDHSNVSDILNDYGDREVYIITATGEDQVEIIVKKKEDDSNG